MEQNFILISGGKRREEVKKQEKIPLSETVLEKTRKTHANAYRPWTDQEEAQLKKLFHRGIPVKEIAVTLGRQIGGVRSRMKKLALKEM